MLCAVTLVSSQAATYFEVLVVLLHMVYVNQLMTVRKYTSSQN